ncbi:hypothetical protein FPZ44_25030 [Paenibacillus agilis]|uniref:Uncharacterized protein n=2 Tax=Paenibacillus agilis TaxID=3020863 RepID=A0A559IDB1_9BACL|nr:hypothetical protein FPZ44_25030 [Paenibacillus agilis]
MYDYSDTGIDALERLIRSQRLTPESVRNNTISLERNRLDLLLGTMKQNEELYDGLSKVIQDIFHTAGQYYHSVLVDLHHGNKNMITNALLESSDLVVVNLSQNMNQLEQFFEKEDWPAALDNKKMIIVLGHYDPKSKYTITNIKRHFKVQVPMFAVPYCSSFKDACNDKDILGWFIKNQNINKKHPNYYFMSEVRKIAKAVLDEVGVNTQLKNIERGA